jgi:hypothetical protein
MEVIRRQVLKLVKTDSEIVIVKNISNVNELLNYEEFIIKKYRLSIDSTMQKIRNKRLDNRKIVRVVKNIKNEESDDEEPTNIQSSYSDCIEKNITAIGYKTSGTRVVKY